MANNSRQENDRENPDFVRFYADITRLGSKLVDLREEMLNDKTLSPLMLVHWDETYFARPSSYSEFHLPKGKEIPLDFSPIQLFARAVYGGWYVVAQEYINEASGDDKELVNAIDKAGKALSEVLLFGIDSTFDNLNFEFSTLRDISAGLSSGVGLMVMLIVLFREKFDPISALIMSKIFMKNFKKALEQTGVWSDIFDLIDLNAPHFINSDILKQYGKGKAVGCPIGNMLPGIDTNTMMTICQNTYALADTVLFPWFKGLNEDEKELLSSQDRALLERTHPLCKEIDLVVGRLIEV